MSPEERDCGRGLPPPPMISSESSRFTALSTAVTTAGESSFPQGVPRAYKISGLHDRRLTGEVLADVDRGTPVDEVLSLQERDVLARTEGDHSIRIEGREGGASDLGVRTADHRQLPRGREMKIEGVEGMAERVWGLRQKARDEAEDADRLALQFWLAPQPREAQQHVREHRVPRRRRIVVEVLLAADELLAVAWREEEAAAFVVAEQRDRKDREPARLLEPAQLARCDMELVEAVGHVRIVLEHACVLRLACAPAPE